MFRILNLTPAGVTVGDTESDLARPVDGTVRWVDLEGQTDEELALLQQRFGFHPLAIEDCAHFDQRPKIEDYGDHLFIVTHGLRCATDDSTEIDEQELHAFLGKDFLVTVHAEAIRAVETTWHRIVKEAVPPDRADFVYYAIVDSAVDSAFDVIDGFSEALHEVEEAVLGQTEANDLAQIFALKTKLVKMRRMMSPQREIFGTLAKLDDERVGKRASLYFRDVYDHLVRISESIDATRDLLGNLLDAHLSLVANRTNEIMKKLTLMSAIFLPLTFITGFFGQNFDHLPFHSDVFMFAMVAACVLVPLGMVVWFYRSKWL